MLFDNLITKRTLEYYTLKCLFSYIYTIIIIQEFSNKSQLLYLVVNN
jgi:hypothetical protein